MDVTRNKIRNKRSPKTPGKGQKTLSSFLIKTVSKPSPGSAESSALDECSQISGSQRQLQGEEDNGKKRKLSQSNNENNHTQPKSKRTSLTNVTSKAVHSSNIIKDSTANHEMEVILIDECAEQESQHEVNAANISQSKYKFVTNTQRKKIFIGKDNRQEFSGHSICDNNMKSHPIEDMKSEIDLASKENSLNEKVSMKNSSHETSKKFPLLKTDSRNIRSPVVQKEENIQESLIHNISNVSPLAKQQKTLLSGSSSECNDDGKNLHRTKDIENEIAMPEKNISGFNNDDFLFDEFDKSFKAEEDMDKTNKESDSNSQPISITSTDEFADIFDEDWTGDLKIDVDLNSLQRCKVSDISRDKFNNLIVNVIHVESQIPVTVTLMGFWKEAKLQPDDIINIQATKQSHAWIVDNNSGFVIEQPDFLVSGTSVVGALFCARRGVLSDKFKGIESINDCKQGANVMAIGTLVHELLQKVLKKKIYTKPGIAKLLKDMLKSRDTANILYSASMSTETCEKEMSPFVAKMFHFIERYVKDKQSQSTDGSFQGRINDVRDIEENLWVPQLGIKGKVDATVEVSVNRKHRIMPLELKTGRASFSLEHRGQVILYIMMMAVTGQDVETGLLLYLRENIMREIKVGHPEQRDLILLRNNLAYYMSRKPEINSRSDSLSSESQLDSLVLPEPINHPACQKCPYAVLCCTYLKNDKNYKLTDRHPLTPVMQELDNYLQPEHIDYVKKWVKMLQIEEADQLNLTQPMKFIWTVPPTQREMKGKCISNLKIIGKVIEEDSGRYRHTFARIDSNNLELIDDFTKSDFSISEYIIVSTNAKVNVCAGPIIELCKDSVTVLLERNLWEKKPNEIFHIDGHTSQSLLILNLSNIGYLLDDNPVPEKMRKIVIERKPATFSKTLDRSVAVVAARILKPLNKTQQRAVLKVLIANDYLLIKGMPGSGKTSTVVAIIELLSKLGKSVLLTAHTHSAVDNVLLKLIKTDVDFLRLGSTSKIHPSLLSKSESVLTQDCYSSESLDTAYNSKNVVGVTCLGANHPLLGKRMFDVCLVDESTQVLQSTVLRPLYSATKFVLIGDPNQLPPLVKSRVARELRMDESLFERLDSENNTITLTSQYRMNHKIMTIANEVTYNGQLNVGTDTIGNATLHIPHKTTLKSCGHWLRTALSADLNDSVTVLDTGSKYDILKNDTHSNSCDYRAERKCSNLCEAAVILRIIRALIQAGVAAEHVGVIAPYREQVNLLRAIVQKDVEVNTVDQYQGRDKEIILYSGTKSAQTRSDVEKDLTILDDHRRFTVAITRAKHKLIIIGDVGSLKQFGPFKKLFDQITSNNLIVLQDGHADFVWKDILSDVKDYR